MRYQVLISIVGAALLASCGHSPEATKAESAKPAVSVRVEPAAASEVPSLYEASGTVRARTSAQISSRVMASVREVRVAVGDRVREGQVLIVLDARDADVRKRVADAAHEEAQSAAAEAEQAITSAKANLDLAESTYSRMKDLFDKTSISRQEFDEATARVKMARAGLAMAQSRRAQVTSKIAQADQEKRGAEILQGYSTLTAPFAGVVTEKNVDPGNIAVPGAPLLTVERGGGFRLEANVEESMMRDIRAGQKVHVNLDTLNREIESRVSEVVPAVDPISRSVVVKIDLPNVPELHGGIFGRAQFETGSKHTLFVPSQAVGERGQVQWVFVAENGIAHSRIVTTGQRRGDRVEILSGLNEGEKLIAPVPPGLTDGDRIEVKL